MLFTFLSFVFGLLVYLFIHCLFSCVNVIEQIYVDGERLFFFVWIGWQNICNFIVNDDIFLLSFKPFLLSVLFCFVHLLPKNRSKFTSLSGTVEALCEGKICFQGGNDRQRQTVEKHRNISGICNKTSTCHVFLCQVFFQHCQSKSNKQFVYFRFHWEYKTKSLSPSHAPRVCFGFQFCVLLLLLTHIGHFNTRWC